MDPNCEYDYFEESDDESSLSSNNDMPDIDIFLHGKYGTRHFKRSNESLDKENIEDFENSMKNELNDMFHNFEQNYNHIDSQKEQEIPDLYDSNSDDENQEWVNNIRKSNLPKNAKKLPSSDAVLNCPSCMSLLCLDCQRHDLYKTQYRAMFVHNCQVDENENVYYPIKSNIGKESKRRKRKANKLSQQTTDIDYDNEEDGLQNDENNPSDKPVECLEGKEAIQAAIQNGEIDVYKKVFCQICKAEVGVYDTDEIYHFHNVLSSYT